MLKFNDFKRERDRSGGFTLVELLVVIAIIGVLVALLLPAVQAAREAARRMQCSNKIKQISLSLHNYHDTYFNFPSSGAPFLAKHTNDYGNRYSCFFAILPFIEQGALYDKYLARAKVLCNANPSDPYIYPWSGDAGPAGTTNEGLDSVRITRVDTLYCPSDGYSKTRESGGWAFMNYAYSLGDFASKEETDYTNPRSAIIPDKIWRGMSYVRDGTSNTVAFSERAVGAAGNKKKVLGTHAVVSGANLQNDRTKPPTDATNCSVKGCRDAQAGKGYVSTLAEGDIHDGVGCRWMQGAPSYTGFNTILPPNSISCIATTNDNTRSISSATSYHSGGVQIGLYDGSVRFVSDTIESSTSGGADFCPTSGKSPFGVWGAYGSCNGDESVSL